MMLMSKVYVTVGDNVASLFFTSTEQEMVS